MVIRLAQNSLTLLAISLEFSLQQDNVIASHRGSLHKPAP